MGIANMPTSIRGHIPNELKESDRLLAAGDAPAAFRHLERAHVLGQASTYDHTRVHWRMLRFGLMNRDLVEIWGQIIRLIGSVTKTPFGIYPRGNTGGANVYFFKRMPVPDDLQMILDGSKNSGEG